MDCAAANTAIRPPFPPFKIEHTRTHRVLLVDRLEWKGRAPHRGGHLGGLAERLPRLPVLLRPHRRARVREEDHQARARVPHLLTLLVRLDLALVQHHLPHVLGKGQRL